MRTTDLSQTSIQLLALAGFVLAPFANAGFKITASIQHAQKKLPLHLYFEKSKVRLDTPSPVDATQEYRVLFDSQTETLSYIDGKKKTFMQMPVVQMQMLADLALRMQQPKGKAPPPKKSPAFSFKNLSKSKKVGPWTCQIFEIQADKKKMGDLCAAPLKDIGMTQGDLQPLQKLSRSLRPLMKFAPEGTEYPEYLWEKVEELGLTLEANSPDPRTGQPSTFIITAIDKKTMPTDTFSVPPGYAQQGILKQ